MEKNGESRSDVQKRIIKAQHAFNSLKKTWNASEILELKNHNKLQTFVNKSLRKILKIYWPDKISNTELCRKTKQDKISVTIKRE